MALLFSSAATRACSSDIWFSTSSIACCNFQRRLLRLCFDAAHRGLGGLEIRLCGIDGRLLHGDGVLKRLLVQLNKEISLFHAVVVIHQNAGNLTVDAGRDECRVTVHEGIVRRNRAEREPDPGNAEPKRGCQGQNADCPEHQVSAAKKPYPTAALAASIGMDLAPRSTECPCHLPEPARACRGP